MAALEALPGAPLGKRNAGGRTPAHMAVAIGDITALEALARAGASLGERDAAGQTPAHWAAANGHAAALEVLARARWHARARRRASATLTAARQRTWLRSLGTRPCSRRWHAWARR